MNETNEVTIVDAAPSVYAQQQASVEKMINQAITSGVPVETMERILAMRKELKSEYAKEQFDRAMTDLQSRCPIIRKNKKGKHGEYASIDHIIANVRDLLSLCGFSYRVEAEMTTEMATATCYVIHRDGHQEKSSFSGKIDSVVSRSGDSVRSSVQDAAAALTFAKRIAFCNAFGIMTGDVDTDGERKDANTQAAISVATLRQMIKDAKLNESVIAGKFNVATIEDLDERNLKVLEKSLLQKLGKDYIPTIQQ